MTTGRLNIFMGGGHRNGVILSGTPRRIWSKRFRLDPSRSTAQDDNLLRSWSMTHERRRALTLVECVMACLIVSILIVAAMRATAVAGVYQYKTADRAA